MPINSTKVFALMLIGCLLSEYEENRPFSNSLGKPCSWCKMQYTTIRAELHIEMHAKLFKTSWRHFFVWFSLRVCLHVNSFNTLLTLDSASSHVKMCRWLTSYVPPLSISSIVVSLWLAGCLAKSTLIGWREYYGGGGVGVDRHLCGAQQTRGFDPMLFP